LFYRAGLNSAAFGMPAGVLRARLDGFEGGH
jgi:hypothetical protein